MNEPQSDNRIPESGSATPQHARSTYKAWATYTILGTTILVFLLQLLTQQPSGTDLMELYGEKINEAIIAGELWRILTPVFLHASLWHILFNMYALFVIGPALEQFYGRARFVLLYFVSGIAGNVVSFYLSPNPSVGASTALFGLISAQAVFIYRNRQFFGGRARSMLGSTLMIVVVNLMLGLTPGIDNWGHMGGLLGGLAFAWAAGPLLDVTWLPGGGYTVVDHSPRQKAWMVGGIETAVLVGLVLLRILQG